MIENNSLVFTDEGLKDVVDKACVVKHTFSNYFGIDLEGVKYYGDEENLFLIKTYDDFSRVYLMANDVEKIRNVLNALPANSCINIPCKKGIDDWIPVFTETVYTQIATYRRYGYMNYRKGNDRNLNFAEIKDLGLIDKELHNFFSPLTGHLPNKEELSKMIEERQIVVNRDFDGQVNGALCYQIKGKKAELPFWFDKSGDGLSLLFNVFYLCHQANIRQIVFWVNDINTNTIAIHKMLGAKADGLVDYIFNNE